MRITTAKATKCSPASVSAKRSSSWASRRKRAIQARLRSTTQRRGRKGSGSVIGASSRSAMREDREACLAAGMDDYLAKPIRVEELVAALLRSQPPR